MLSTNGLSFAIVFVISQNEQSDNLPKSSKICPHFHHCFTQFEFFAHEVLRIFPSCRTEYIPYLAHVCRPDPFWKVTVFWCAIKRIDVDCIAQLSVRVNECLLGARIGQVATEGWQEVQAGVPGAALQLAVTVDQFQNVHNVRQGRRFVQHAQERVQGCVHFLKQITNSLHEDALTPCFWTLTVKTPVFHNSYFFKASPTNWESSLWPQLLFNNESLLMNLMLNCFTLIKLISFPVT